MSNFRGAPLRRCQTNGVHTTEHLREIGRDARSYARSAPLPIRNFASRYLSGDYREGQKVEPWVGCSHVLGASSRMGEFTQPRALLFYHSFIGGIHL